MRSIGQSKIQENHQYLTRWHRTELYYLPETHLICKNTIDTLLVEGSQPVETLELVLFQGSHQHLGLLNSQLSRQRRRILEVELIRVHYTRCVSLEYGH